MEKEKQQVKAVVVAGGKGKRMGASCHKQYIMLHNKPVLAHTLQVFQDCTEIEEIVLVVGEGEVEFCQKEILDKYQLSKVARVVEGGKERFHSVYNGLVAIDNCSIVLIHDGARPFVKEEIILNSIMEAQREGAVIVGVPVKDTIKIINDNMEVANTPARKTLWAIQTPQTFRYSLLREAYDKNQWDESITDDASLMEKVGQRVKVIMGDYENIKLTTPDDLLIAEKILMKGEEN
ncbi:2-C-methyl-D-erythritol 4-phosphate cytidylyltransferase [Alkaliphilus hydrothermalis]|uniref:2-C-methyl-D-erythritol 4-phosphate cytidylyltransferase n=1 Tax=Alkaliphilus hydrothermalis TaxID=1482730 RepID=A0ABS2NQU9_9FIRM|nr:2-C-methyl-D-erythritol 4-phosphate cytidylyltransferase [Alkaliphilus hydrothermalis]MBM7615335.1 2-C-methyl-D-erythritol 4-phosphate cytidylyltransferase [Alkaliphilus hydrothermalis]